MSLISAWHFIHEFWGWGLGGFATLATLADAIKGFSWLKALVGKGLAKMFGASEIRKQIAILVAQNLGMEDALQLIAKELKPNGGSSLRDAINRIDDRVDKMDTRQTLQYERVKALSMDSTFGVQEFNPEGELIWCNRTYLRLMERDLTEVLGYGWLNCIHPHDRDGIKDTWLASVRNQMAYEGGYRVQRPNGEVIQISVRATVMRSENQVLGYITTVSIEK